MHLHKFWASLIYIVSSRPDQPALHSYILSQTERQTKISPQANNKVPRTPVTNGGQQIAVEPSQKETVGLRKPKSLFDLSLDRVNVFNV